MYWWAFAIGSAAASTVYTLLRKTGTKKEHSLEFEMTRSIFVALFGLVLIPFLSFKYDAYSIFIIYFSSIFACAGILLTTKSIRHSEISEVTPLHNLTPGFAAVLAFIFLGESISFVQIAGILLLIVGAYVIEIKGNFFKSVLAGFRSKYIDYSIYAALIFSFTALLDKYIINNLVPAFDMLFLILIFISINFVFLSALEYGVLKGVRRCIRVSGHHVVGAALFSFLSDVLYIYALSFAYLSLVLPIKRLSSFFTVLIGGEIFHESHRMQRLFACIIMVVGACLIIV